MVTQLDLPIMTPLHVLSNTPPILSFTISALSFFLLFSTERLVQLIVFFPRKIIFPMGYFLSTFMTSETVNATPKYFPQTSLTLSLSLSLSSPSPHLFRPLFGFGIFAFFLFTFRFHCLFALLTLFT